MHTSNSQKPSMNHPQPTMGPWGLSICVFANMQDCHAPKTTNPSKLQKKVVCGVGGFMVTSYLSIHLLLLCTPITTLSKEIKT